MDTPAQAGTASLTPRSGQALQAPPDRAHPPDVARARAPQMADLTRR